MFPNRIRAAALSLAAAGQWVANWVITVTFPALKDLSLGLAYGIYATAAVLSFLFVARWVRETKGGTGSGGDGWVYGISALMTVSGGLPATGLNLSASTCARSLSENLHAKLRSGVIR